MVWIHFSKRSEAQCFYKKVVSEHKNWLINETEDGFTVTLDQPVIKKDPFFEVLQACLSFILERKWLGWMEGALRHQYHYSDRQEIERILEIGQDFLMKTPKGVKLPPVRSYLQAVIKDQLANQIEFYFDELAVTCLVEVRQLLIDYTGKVIDEYKQEETYQLLLDSWRFRVHHKDTGVRRIHVLEKDSLQYFHDEGNPISHSETRLYLKQYPDDSVQELPIEWSITPAIVHAPDELIIYSDKNENSSIELLLNIFEEKALLKPVSYFPF